MNRKRIFYPMITSTLKNVLQLVDPLDIYEVINVICAYPNHELSGDLASKPIIEVILGELDRQYARWNHGGNDENID